MMYVQLHIPKMLLNRCWSLFSELHKMIEFILVISPTNHMSSWSNDHPSIIKSRNMADVAINKALVVKNPFTCWAMPALCHKNKDKTKWLLSERRGSNPRPSAWHADTLSLSYSRIWSLFSCLFFLPFPLFNPPYVGVRLWQLGHSTFRLLGCVLSESPSVWSTVKGILLVIGWISFQPHLVHLLSACVIR